MKLPIALAVTAPLVFACVTSYVPRTNSRGDLQNYVDRAARLVRENGPAACASFSTRAWKGGDYYIFVTNAVTSVTVCQPVRPDMVGQSQADLQDPTGKYIIREMLAAASGPEQRGWVEYLWPRPGETVPTTKTAYVVGVTGPDGTRYLVGSGSYNLLR